MSEQSPLAQMERITAKSCSQQHLGMPKLYHAMQLSLLRKYFLQPNRNHLMTNVEK